MKLFDKYMDEAAALLQPYLKEYGRPVTEEGPLWPLTDRNPFIMERDTALELGGYPKESVNLIISSSQPLPFRDEGGDGTRRVLNFTPLRTGGNEDFDGVERDFGAEKHLSFGKIVFLQTEEFTDDAVYEFQQSVQLADLRLKLEYVMTRSSSRQYQINLRVGKKAAEAGLSLDSMVRTICEQLCKVPGVKDAAVILLAGDSPVYKQLLPLAEKVKDVTAALNTMFDGIDMDCGSCSLNEICDEVEGLRELHRNKRKESV